MIYCSLGDSQRLQSSSGDSRGLWDCWWSSHLCCMGWFLTWASIFFRLLFNVVEGEGFYCRQYLSIWVPHIMSYNIISFQNGQAVTRGFEFRRSPRALALALAFQIQGKQGGTLQACQPCIRRPWVECCFTGTLKQWKSPYYCLAMALQECEPALGQEWKSTSFFSLNLILSLTCFIMFSFWERLGLGWGRKMSLSH